MAKPPFLDGETTVSDGFSAGPTGEAGNPPGPIGEISHGGLTF